MAQDLRNLQAQDIRFKVDDREYYWGGGFGDVFRSFERGVAPGDVRVIGGVLFTAYRVSRLGRHWWNAPQVCWKLPEPFDAAMLAKIKASLFGYGC